MQLKVTIRTLADDMFGIHTVTVARAPTAGGMVARSRVEFKELFLVPAGCKAEFTLRSLEAGDTEIETTLYVYDANYPTADAAIRISQTPTISTTEYHLGDAVGGKLTFAGAVNTGANRGAIVGCRVKDKSKVSEPLELWLFREDFTPTTNHDTFNPFDSDLVNLAAVVRISDWFDSGGNSVGQAVNLPLSVVLDSGDTTLYGQLVTRGTPQYGDTNHLVVELEVAKE
jgi:hypothetical protein